MRQVLILFMSLVCYASFAQNVAYNPNKSKGKLYEYAQLAKAENGDVNINSILEDESNLEFTTLTSENQSVGFSTDNYWLTFDLENSSNTSKNYYLQTARPVTDVANLLQVANKII